MGNKPVMKTKILFRMLVLFAVFLIVGSGCKVFHHHHRSNGQLISTKPHGRLAPGEIDDMSGSKNGMPAKKNEKAFGVNKKSAEKDKKSEEKYRKQYEPWQNKKHKKR